jgi:hypothetical protein
MIRYGSLFTSHYFDLCTVQWHSMVHLRSTQIMFPAILAPIWALSDISCPCLSLPIMQSVLFLACIFTAQRVTQWNSMAQLRSTQILFSSILATFWALYHVACPCPSLPMGWSVLFLACTPFTAWGVTQWHMVVQLWSTPILFPFILATIWALYHVACPCPCPPTEWSVLFLARIFTAQHVTQWNSMAQLRSTQILFPSILSTFWALYHVACPCPSLPMGWSVLFLACTSFTARGVTQWHMVAQLRSTQILFHPILATFWTIYHVACPCPCLPTERSVLFQS